LPFKQIENPSFYFLPWAPFPEKTDGYTACSAPAYLHNSLVYVGQLIAWSGKLHIEIRLGSFMHLKKCPAAVKLLSDCTHA
jgi:hypothetical protein